MAFLLKHGKDSLPLFQSAEVCIFEEMLAQGIDYFLEHYCEMYLEFSGQLILPIDI